MIGVIVPQPEAFLDAFLGASYAGLLPAPVYPPHTVARHSTYLDMLQPVLSASGARAVVTTRPLRRVFDSAPTRPTPLDVVPVEELTGPALGAPENVDLAEPAFVQFTSGSTSEPKGVVLTHGNLATNIEAITGPAGLAIQDHDVAVSWLPLFHDLGLIGMTLGSLYRGIRAYFMPPSVFLKRPAEWLRAITRHRGSVSFAPSFAYQLCARRVRESELAGLDLSTWRIAGCGAEPVQASALSAFAAKFGPAGFREASLLACYGLAEHNPWP